MFCLCVVAVFVRPDVDECAADVPVCKNDAGCTNSDGGYTCACTAGWTGATCDTGGSGCGDVGGFVMGVGRA